MADSAGTGMRDALLAYYRAQTKFAKVMFSQMSVCLQGEGGGVSVSVRGSMSRRSLSRAVSVQGGLCFFFVIFNRFFVKKLAKE